MSLSILVKIVSPESVVIELEGEVDISTVDNLLAEIEKYNVKTIVLDCSGISFIDSTGIGFLLRKTLELKDEGRDLTLNSIPDLIYEIFDEMGIFEILTEFNGR